MQKTLIAAAVAALSGAAFRRSFVPEGVSALDAARERIDRLSFYAKRALQKGLGAFGEMEFGGAPAWSDLSNYAVMRPDAVEAVRQPLYDSLLYAAAGQTQLRFFQNPQGAGLSVQQGNAGNPKTLGDTNMELAGQLANPKAFLCTSIEMIFEPGSVTTANTFTPLPVTQTGQFVSTNVSLASLPTAAGLNDIQVALQSGWLDLFLISKSYLQNARGDSFPPKSHLSWDASFSAGGTLNAVAVGVGGRAIGRPFYVNPPVLIMPNTNFNLTFNWPVAIALPSTFNGRLICRLDGFLYRNAQ